MRSAAGLYRAAGSRSMLNLVNVGRKSLADYASISTRGLMAEIDELAEPLVGKRVLHLSATAFGGGVAEINYTLVPLMADVGLEVEWRIIQPIDGFFDVTKTIHNALQGNPEGLTEEQQETYRRCNAENARLLDGDYDLVIVHDAQPAAMIETAAGSSARWIWRCHIDLSTPNEDVLGLLAPLDCQVRRGDLPYGGLRAARRCAAAFVHLAAGDRPVGAEEHGAAARGVRVHRQPVRDRHEPAAPDPGVPFRPLEGPARRDRRLSPREAGAPGRTARARRLDGA